MKHSREAKERTLHRLRSLDSNVDLRPLTLAQRGADTIGGLRGVLWHRCADSRSLEGEPFVALKHKVPFRSFYDVKQLPAATVVCSYSGLDNQSAGEGYDAIRKWMNVRNYQLAGPEREIYLDQMLEIQFPLKSA
jgi:effector-binding domain-containing protein